MSGPLYTWPATHSIGDAGHTADHNEIVQNGIRLAASSGGWINAAAPPYNADPTGQSDATAAINNALSAAKLGQPVYLPAGLYATTSQLSGGPWDRLVGDGANVVSTYLDGLGGTVIQPQATWAPTNPNCPANAVLAFCGQGDGNNYPTVAVEGKLGGIMLDCHLINGLNNPATDGLQLYGAVSRLRVRDMLVAHPPNCGLNYVADGGGNTPGAIHMEQFNVRYAGYASIVNGSGTAPQGYGVWQNKISDCTYYECLMENCFGDGWNIVNLSNGILAFTRSEHNGNNGVGNGYTYTCTNSGTGSGTGLFLGITTDRNEGYGMEITTTNGSGVPVQLVGPRFRRDGANGNAGGGNLAGLYVHGYPSTVQVVGGSVWPGVNDSGSGTLSPQYALKLANNSSRTIILLSGTTLVSASQPVISDDGTATGGGGPLYDAACTAGYGSTGNPTWQGPRQGTGHLSSGTATVPCTSVTANSNIQVTPTSTGVNAGVPAVTAKTAGTSFTVTSSNASDANTFAWTIGNP